MPNSENKFDVFISHADEDTEWSEQLATHLRNAGIRVWFDKWQMQEIGVDLVEGMEEGLAKSRRALLVLTPDYLSEKKIWAAAERRFITYKNITGRREYAIPLLLRNCTLPPFLEALQRLDFRSPAAYEVNIQQLISMLKGAPEDDATPTLIETTDKVPALGQLPPNSYLPYEWNPHFAGRSEELKKLHRLLNRGENVVAVNQLAGKVAITGFGGYGKTQLAIEYAFRYGRYYTGGVYWINSEESENFQSALASLAIPMGLNLPVDLPVKDYAGRVLALLRRPEPSLLILDNVDNLAVLKQFSVAGGGCRVLITTRRTDLERIEKMSIDVLDKNAALNLLLSRRPDLKSSTSSSNHPFGEKICERLGCLPLALEFAAFYLGRHKRLSLEDYLKELEKVDTLEHTALLGADYKQSPTGYELGVVESFQLSFHELVNAPNAQRLFLAACQFALESINLNLLGEVTGLDLATHDGENSLNLLHDLSLCKQNENGRLQLHRLVIEFGQRVTLEKDKINLQARFIETMLNFMKVNNDATKLKEVQPEFPHVLYATEVAIAQKAWPHNVDLSYQIGVYFDHWADYSACFTWWQRAKEICETHQPLDEKRLGNILYWLGYVNWRLGDLSVALETLHQALDIVKKVFGEEHWRVGQIRGQIGEVLQYQENSVDAMPYFQQAVEILKKSYGQGHPDLTWILLNMGEILATQGDWGRAQKLIQEALTISKKIFGKEHPRTAMILNSFGMILYRHGHGKLAEALRLNLQSLNIRKKVFGEEHDEVAESLYDTGLVLHEQGDVDGSLSHFQQSLVIRRKLFREDNSDIAYTLKRLGLILYTKGDLPGAADYLGQSLGVFEKVYGSKHPETKNVRELLAKVEGAKEE